MKGKKKRSFFFLLDLNFWFLKIRFFLLMKFDILVKFIAVMQICKIGEDEEEEEEGMTRTVFFF